MRRILWLGAFLLSSSWLFLIPQFITPNLPAGLLCVLFGVLCFIIGISSVVTPQPNLRYLVLLFPLTIAALLVPFPHNLGVILLGLGLLFVLLCYRFERLQAIPLGISLAGVLLLLQTLIFPLYVSLASHGHRVDVLASVISPIANFLGFHTSATNGFLFVQTLQTTPFTITWESLGCPLALNLFLAGFFLLLLFSKTKQQMLKNTIIFLIAGTSYLLLRFIAILSLYLTTTELSVFWDPLLTTLSFLPFSLLLMKLIPLQKHETVTIQAPSIKMTKKHLATMVLLILLVSSLTAAFLYHDPGVKKTGRVLIDEYHSQWEDTLRPLDTEWYGLLSTYNYYSWGRWISYHYPVETNTNETFTTSLLSHYDILILKCPTESYTTQEIQAIKDFVTHGGGLYLIGDHTNVFGMNTFLNQVSEEFGIRFKTDASYELGTGDLSVYTPDRSYAHPVLRQVPQFEFMTSCTLEPTSLSASLQMENIIIGNRLISEPGTYSTENFFRESIASPDSEYGYLLQAAAITYGAGRVVAFTDSTVFSSFCLYTDGYPAFTLGALEYLNRSNSPAPLSTILFVLAVVLFLLIAYLVKNINKTFLLWMILFSGLLAFCLTAPLCSYLTDLSYQPTEAALDYPTVVFEQQHSTVNISVKPTASLGVTSTNYGTFYIWTQRVGLVPSLAPTLHDATTNGDVIILINPTRAFTETDVKLITTYLEHGGRLLLMDSITNPESTANELLGNFGLWITTESTNKPLYTNETENGSLTLQGNITTPSLTITGGTPLLISNDNNTYASMVEITNPDNTKAPGYFVVIVDSASFSDAQMGGTFTEPTDQQRQIYNTEFFLLRTLLSS
ncbi:MAG: GldG family protein [Candidatus Thermoplasmatota archaeon]|nr:GldG family protein [Candidatus Thermoplasmatota archaeon]